VACTQLLQPMICNSWELIPPSEHRPSGRQKLNLNVGFWLWLGIQGKAPTTDNLLKKGWPGNPNCALCYCESETNDHLFTECNFSKDVWDRIVQIFHVHPAAAPFQKGNVQGWLAACGEAGSKQQQLETAGIVCFFWWHIWKEQNRWIFEHQECSLLQVVQLIREAISDFRRVHQG
jgi:hypothetical protein